MAIDILGRLVDRIMNKTNLRMFNRYSDSLESISEGEITYMGVTSGAGDAAGMTLVCAALAALPDYSMQRVKILSDGATGLPSPSFGQIRNIVSDIAGTITVDHNFTNAAGAAQQIAANIEFVIIPGAGGGAVTGDIDFLEGFPYINEPWEPANIDLNIWTPTHPATNNIVVVENVAPNVGYSVVEFDVEAAETARLIGRASVNRWRVVPTLIDVNHAVKQFLMEWQIYFNDVANVTEATIFMGLVTLPGDTRASNNIVGFGITGGVLDSITDRGGARTPQTGFGETLEDTRNKLRIMVDADNIYFYVNEVLHATHAVAAELPDQLMYPCWYMPATAAFEFYLGAVRIGYVDIP